jgi:threonylcarbamoyladenosine tRNA methylthiotransferase MtaB
MNRQYGRDDFLAMVDRINTAFDRPALTTDIIVGFPGEDDAEFEQTIDIARRSGFIHTHAFPYSPRPGTAAARWNDQFIHGPVVNQRIARLMELAAETSLEYRRSFVGQFATVVLERGSVQHDGGSYRHGRTERYFPVLVADDGKRAAGEELQVQIDHIEGSHTIGSIAAEVPA